MLQFRSRGAAVEGTMAPHVALTGLGSLTGTRFPKVGEFEDATFLLLAETGTGKGRIARALPELYGSGSIHTINRMVTNHARLREGVLVLVDN
jgi:hypothetical protein